MKFYEVDDALREAISAGDKPVRVKIEIASGGDFFTVPERDVIEANFYGLKEAAGGTSARGAVVIDNALLALSNREVGSEVKVSFSLGEGLPWFQRFVFYVDENGIQDIRGAGRKRYVKIGLRDLSAKLRKTDETRDWTSPAVFTYSVACDKTRPERSLVHGIARRAGLSVNDIDCSTIPVTLPYVKLRKNIWAELSALAVACRCHVECAPEKPLVFAHSPYQVEPQADDDCSCAFSGDDIFYLRKAARADLYRNTVRLKINLPVTLERREIWRYGDSPVLYDEFTQAYYPFRYPLEREIEAGKYEARYRIKDSGGRERAVVFADEIDTRAEAENRLEYDGGAFSYSLYDTSSYCDRAILTLKKDSDGDLYKAAIFGRPIALDLNRSCFMRDADGIAAYGTAAVNITGSYFSECGVGGESGTLPHYEDWVSRELAERSRYRREFTVKTHRALFNARVGAKARVAMRNEQLTGVISAFSLRYKRDSAFIAAFKMVEE